MFYDGGDGIVVPAVLEWVDDQFAAVDELYKGCVFAKGADFCVRDGNVPVECVFERAYVASYFGYVLLGFLPVEGL